MSDRPLIDAAKEDIRAAVSEAIALIQNGRTEEATKRLTRTAQYWAPRLSKEEVDS